MKILIACEESQRVCIEFRKLGHEAYSCDLLPCSGGHPEWHIQGDVVPLLDQNWDMIIAFPPCTYFTTAGGQCWREDLFGHEYVENRKLQRQSMFEFVLKIWNSDCPLVSIENPVGWLSTHWQKPTQIIEPYFFGDPVKKRTCLWLRGLQKLVPTNMLDKPKPTYTQSGGVRSGVNRYFAETIQGSINRSKTFIGVARAMAQQWGSNE